MARIFRVSIDLYPPGQLRPHYCIESFETVRTAKPNRVLHFGLGEHPSAEDVEWIREVVGMQLESLIIRTVGVSDKLAF